MQFHYNVLQTICYPTEHAVFSATFQIGAGILFMQEQGLSGAAAAKGPAPTLTMPRG